MSLCRIETVHSLPGRVRISISGLRGNRPFARSLEKTLQRNENVYHVKANPQTGKALILYNRKKTSQKEILTEVNKDVYYILQRVAPIDVRQKWIQRRTESKRRHETFEPEDIPVEVQVTQVVVTGGILLGLVVKRCFWKKSLLAFSGKVNLLATVTTLVAGYPIIRSGVETLVTRKKLNNDMLISTATVVSLLLKENITGLVVVWLVNLSTLFQTLTMEKSRKAIKDMLQGREETAWIEIDGTVVSIPVENVEVGNTILCYIGGRVPVDGEITDGEAAVSQAIITGESMPVIKTLGDKIYAGSIVEQGSIKIRVEKAGQDTSIAKIVAMVEEASRDRAPVENMADRYADRIVPYSFGLAALVYVLTRDFKRSMTMLVVACPCAAGLATPTAISASMGNAARKGILVKGGSYLEKVGKTNVVLFDKTGTLTEGKPSVREVLPMIKTVPFEQIIQLASSVEYQTNHPLANAVVMRAEEMKLGLLTVEHKEIIIGKGVSGSIENVLVAVGNEALMKEIGVNLMRAKAKAYRLYMLGQTVLYVARDNRLIGLIGVADNIRPDSKMAIRKLRQAGIKTIGLVSGDCNETAELVARELGLNEFWAETMPAEKVRIVKDFQQAGYTVTMVGDGINDSPALATADIGIAMGTGGTDVAIESADIVLAADDPLKIASVIRLSNHTMEIVKQNFLFAVGINVSGLLLGAGKLITPLTAAILHNLSTFGVVVNSSRLFNYNPDSGKGRRRQNARHKRTRR
ncbi:MAG: cation-translocating P-type ATPase [Clostridiales bacterium]|jgi:heavy metal translocating P-type ATPase|nr:cation-translocating P-type ATPase [Clostridiales bacterium]